MLYELMKFPHIYNGGDYIYLTCIMREGLVEEQHDAISICFENRLNYFPT